MEILVSNIKKNDKPYVLEENITFQKDDYSQVFSLKDIKSVKVKATCENYGELIQIKLRILAKLILICSYTLEDVDYSLKVNETLDFSFEPIDGEIFEINGNVIELDELVLGIIIANIPLRVKKEGAKLPNIKGVRVLSEDEYLQEKSKALDPRLKILDEWEE